MANHPAQFIWMNGQFLSWPDANVHVGTDVVLRGSNVFEGIRAYFDNGQDQMFIFRLEEHLDRLWKSMKVMRMTCPYSADELRDACLELVSKNEFREHVHLRPVVYFGDGPLFAYKVEEISLGAFILALPRPTALGTPKTISCCVSAWRRISDNVMPPRVKAGANYQQSRLVTVQAHVDGYDSAIILNEQGTVSEGPGSCLMIVRDGGVITPPVTAGILESITRETVAELLGSEMGVEVVERDIDRTELYIADELFYCGSGHEVLPITSVDRYLIGEGSVGPVCRELQGIYFDVVRGRIQKYNHWITPVY